MVGHLPAVVLGSAVCAGHWLKPARALPDQNRVDVAQIVTLTGARDHHLFAGKLIRKQLSFPERAIVAAIAWNAFGGRRDLDRRHRGRDPGAPD